MRSMLRPLLLIFFMLTLGVTPSLAAPEQQNKMTVHLTGEGNEDW